MFRGFSTGDAGDVLEDDLLETRSGSLRGDFHEGDSITRGASVWQERRVTGPGISGNAACKDCPTVRQANLTRVGWGRRFAGPNRLVPRSENGLLVNGRAQVFQHPVDCTTQGGRTAIAATPKTAEHDLLRSGLPAFEK